MLRLLIGSFAVSLMVIKAFIPQWSDKEVTIISALQHGEATELSLFLNNTVLLKLNNEQKACSKNQATVLLNDFFEEQRVEDFFLAYSTNNSGNSGNFIGTLLTKNGQFRTSYTTKRIGSIVVINELAFEK